MTSTGEPEGLPSPVPPSAGTEDSDGGPGAGFRKRVVRGAMWAWVRTWGAQGTNFLVFLVLARVLKAQDFGLVALAGIYLSFLDLLTEQGFGAALVQRAKLEAEHLDGAFWVSCVIGVTFMLFTIALAPLIATVFGEPRLRSILMALSVTVLFAALRSVQDAVLRRNLAFRVLAMRAISANVIGGGVGVTLALSGAGVWALVGQQIAQEATALVVLWTAGRWRPRWQLSTPHVRELLGISLDVVGTRVIGFANGKMADILIGYSLGSTALGYYSIGIRFITTIDRTLIRTVTQVATPAFSRLQGDAERMRRAYYRATQFTSLIGFPVFIGAAALASTIVPMFFGVHWLPSVPVMQVVAIAGLQRSIGSVNGTVMLSNGRPDLQLRLLAVSGVVGLIAILIGAKWGIVGVAVAAVIRSVLMAPVTATIVRRVVGYDVRTYLGQFVGPAAASAALVSVIAWLNHAVRPSMPASAYILVATAAGAVVYIAALRVAAPSIIPETLNLMRAGVPERFRFF